MSKTLRVAGWCGALALLCFWSASAHAEGVAQKTATYSEAKAIVMKNGFKAIAFNHKNDSLLCSDDGLCRKRPEVFYCSGVGLNLCDFAFERTQDHRRVVIETFGDDSIKVKEVRAANKLDEQRIKEHW